MSGTLAILCSGQGGQHAQMFALTASLPRTQPLFLHAAELLGEDPRRLVLSGPKETLQENTNGQVLCTVQGLAAAAALDGILPLRRCIAGYSVGEMTAWGVAGLFSAVQTMDLVAARSAAMNAAQRGAESMLFIRGLSRSEVEALCAGREAAIAIVNPGAWVVGGRKADLDDIALTARQAGAARISAVGVTVASHTRFMGGATTSFGRTLSSLDLRGRLSANIRLLSGVDAAPVLNIAAGLEKLAAQLSQPVQWDACLEACVEAGASAFLELGPGRALAEMAAATYPHLPARSLDDFRTMDGVHTWLAQPRSA